MDPAAQAAAEATEEAGRQSTIETWTLYGIGVVVTILRTYARANAVGFRDLRADDYLVWVAILFYTVQSTLAYSVGSVAHGLANNGMPDKKRAALSPNDTEYELRIIGSKIQVAGWATYSALIWLLKLAMLVFYLRLTQGLGRRYRIRIWIGFGLVLATFLGSICAIFLACIPFHKYWQISPDPGNSCQAAVSLPIVWTSFAANVSTDIYLILIPIPLLWESTLRLAKKIASTIVLGAGIFVLICATLKSVFVLVDPVNGAELAGKWGTRETFVAVVTTNLPMIFPLVRTWMNSLWPSILHYSKRSKKSYKTSTGLRTIGGGSGDSRSQDRRTGNSRAHTVSSNPIFTESEEHIIMNYRFKKLKGPLSALHREQASKGIVVSNEFGVVTEDRMCHIGPKSPERVYEAW
ncbi:hypothetical protein CDEST_07355 [Colletotrichum destructivum]|uniref:Rhodopsin domain-containing protein n=1 Tax=Colletotrichum destructivum TaxID=34406 RepID=A0AAX4IG58_9PEZI|nr:hypothetical protein CDEST_07355 [Colletotrichum destructivum]